MSASAYMPPLVPGHMVKSTSEFLPQKKVMCVYLIDFMAPMPPCAAAPAAGGDMPPMSCPPMSIADSEIFGN
ncbi:Os01g0770750 [Oryza sativa Japonica Group]|uniref:Os01g0770750 protein n=1 Tax=Oryza sativa subsp. japonica TaxID=39947 RepID=A0A0P0V8P6_ORYSJ|nr:Os01g0770750 [Oryza sativa Japonica Group]